MNIEIYFKNGLSTVITDVSEQEKYKFIRWVNDSSNTLSFQNIFNEKNKLIFVDKKSILYITILKI